MPLPAGVPTFTLVASFPPLAADGAARSGTLTFTPIPRTLPSPDAVYLGVENATLDASGAMSKELVACDAFADPFIWRVDGNIDGELFSTNISVAASAGTVNLGAAADFEALPPDYVVVLGPQGPEGPAGTGSPSSTVTSQTAFGAASSAGVASTYSRGDHAHGTPAAPTAAGLGALAAVNNLSDVQSASSARVNLGLGSAATQATSAFDAAGAASSALSSAQTYADSGDAATLTSANAYTDSHSGGASVRSQGDDRIDVEIVTLTNTGAWTVVRSSGGTAIGKSVRAAVGDRVLVIPAFMYAGNQYQLDLAVMASNGTSVTRYASSSGSSSTPGPEGFAPLYTQAASFPHSAALAMFTVAAGEVDGSSMFTVNLAYIAPSLSGTDQKIYAGSGYLARWVMLNLGPEPA